MPPKSWKPCPHCGQPFSPASIEMHMKRCTMREDVRAEHDLRELEGFHRPPPLPDWPQCPNCGERYGPHAIGPHVKRCRRLRPNGANGFGPGGGGGEAPGAEPFKGLWGIGDVEGLLQKLREAMGITSDTGLDEVRSIFRKWDVDGNGVISEKEMVDVLKRLCPDFTDEQIRALFQAADVNKDGSVNYEEFINFLMCGPKVKLSQDDLDALRAIFDRFDEDSDGLLNTPEFTNLLQNMLPARADDFEVADFDGNGAIDFDEFVKYWTSIVGAPGFDAGMFDEAVDMFECFDKDNSGELDRHEFAKLLNNLFPDHCDDNEKHVDAEFAACDANSGGGISFPEFLAYYDRLRMFYGERKTGWPPMDPVARKTSLNQEFVTSHCGLKFLPDRLPVHRRSCQKCKKAAAAEAAEAAAARKRAEEEKRKAEEAAAAAAAAQRKAEEDARKAAEDARRQADEEAARKAKAAEDARRQADEEARRRELAARKAAEDAAAKAAAARKRSDGLEECRYCGRTFFPDRLPVHERCCTKKCDIHGIRPTMTPGETKATIGRYEIPK